MNLIDSYVTEIIAEPYQEYGKWWIKVKADGYDRISELSLMFDDFDDADNVFVGMRFLS